MVYCRYADKPFEDFLNRCERRIGWVIGALFALFSLLALCALFALFALFALCALFALFALCALFALFALFVNFNGRCLGATSVMLENKKS